jgi:hypothetical protein
MCFYFFYTVSGMLGMKTSLVRRANSNVAASMTYDLLLVNAILMIYPCCPWSMLPDASRLQHLMLPSE